MKSHGNGFFGLRMQRVALLEVRARLDCHVLAECRVLRSLFLSYDCPVELEFRRRTKPIRIDINLVQKDIEVGLDSFLDLLTIDMILIL